MIESLVGLIAAGSAATAIAAWQGAAVFRAHQVLSTRRVVEMAAAIRGTRAPLAARRGLV